MYVKDEKKMKNFSEILDLKDGESILYTFQANRQFKMRTNRLNQKYHNLNELPSPFFHVDEEFITFTQTHVFTNKRYIAIGVNFPQQYDYEAVEFIVRGDIVIDNYLLSIDKHHLTKAGVGLGSFENSIYVGDFIEIKCYTQKKFADLRTFLIEKWDIAESQIEEEELRTCNHSMGVLKLRNILQYPFLLILSSVVIMNSITAGYISTANWILGIFHGVFILLLFVDSWFVFSKKSNKKKILSINFRVVFTWGFFVVIFILLICVVMFSR